MHCRFNGLGALAAALALTVGCAGASEEAPTPARLVGTVSVEPLAGPLDEPLRIYVDDSISGAVLEVPLTPQMTTADRVTEAVNAGTRGRVLASLENSRVVLTSVEAGQDVFLSVYDNSSAETLGLARLPLARGAAASVP